MVKIMNDCIEMITLKHSALFQRAPGYTLEQLQRISEREHHELNKLEEILINYQASHRQSELDEFAHHCQTASDRLLFRLIRHSKPLKDFLSQPTYNSLWEDRIERQGLQDSMTNTTLAFHQWENNFLTSHYKTWQKSRHSNHAMAQSLKDKLELSHALISNTDKLHAILVQ